MNKNKSGYIKKLVVMCVNERIMVKCKENY